VDLLTILNIIASPKMVNQKAQDAIQKSLDSVTGDKSSGIAGIVFVAVDVRPSFDTIKIKVKHLLIEIVIFVEKWQGDRSPCLWQNWPRTK
jgi:hypothetical protein